MDRTVDYLLRKYETKQPGEQWKLETEVQYIQEYRDKQKIRTLDTIINQNFRIPLKQKRRAQYLIKDLDFQDMGGWTNAQIILMIIIYVKLEANRKNHIIHYKKALCKYDLTTDSFISFLVTLNKHHIKKIPLTC